MMEEARLIFKAIWSLKSFPHSLHTSTNNQFSGVPELADKKIWRTLEGRRRRTKGKWWKSSEDSTWYLYNNHIHGIISPLKILLGQKFTLSRSHLVEKAPNSISQWNKCWSLHMKINLHHIGAGLKDYMDLFLYCVFTTIFMRNKYIESKPWLHGWTQFLKSRRLHISSLHID